jgi:hypothetical protein
MTSFGAGMSEVMRDGSVVVRGVLDGAQISELIGVVEERARMESARGGVRNLLDVPEFRVLANSDAVMSLATAVLGEGAFVVRGILFDKTDAANWKVPWHQDVTIAVTNRIEADGYGPWSVKAGAACAAASFGDGADGFGAAASGRLPGGEWCSAGVAWDAS